MRADTERDPIHPVERIVGDECQELEERDPQVEKAGIGPVAQLIALPDPARYPERPDPGRCPVTAYLQSLGKRSRYTMERSLMTILRVVFQRDTISHTEVYSFPWHDLRFQHTAAIRSALAERYPNVSTVNLHLAALRGVLKAAWRLGLIDGPDYHRAVDIASVKGCALPKGRSLDAGEIRALFEACARDQSAAGRRDAALLAVAYGAGLRRSEIAGLLLDDYDVETGAMVVRGKGNKERMAYLAGGAKAAVADWLKVRQEEPGPLFVRVRKDGTVGGQGVSAQAIYNALRKRGREAGVESFSPHDLRRTFVSDLLDAGADIALVQKLAGHAQVTTTAVYDRRPARAQQKAAELLFVPYSRRDNDSAE